jgi:hypothetical protein
LRAALEASGRDTEREVKEMTHDLGRVVVVNQTVSDTAPLDFVPGPGPQGGPRFVILHFTNVNLQPGAALTVALGYGTDSFDVGAGPSFWSRPADTSSGPIHIRVTGGTGTALLDRYGSGEPAIPPGQTPGTSIGSLSNPDFFLQTNPYVEPTYETRLECTQGFAWENAACGLSPISDAIRQKVAASVGIIVEVDPTEVSSCSGTLIGSDLFLTARHCLTDPTGEDVRSASVTFDYATACNGAKPAGHTTRFFKVLEEVASGVAPTGTENIPIEQDWVVVRLDAAPGSLPPPLALRDAALMAGEPIFTMHHPNGAVKKTQSGVFGGGASVTGFDYAGGSSGSGLFDGNGDLVGATLHAGSGCSVQYAPGASVKAGLATPPPPPNPLDVMIVFDQSGSMGSAAPPVGRSKLQEAQDASALFVQLVRGGAGDRLGLVTFSSGAATLEPLTPAAAAKPTLVGPAPFTTGLIGGIPVGGSTSIGKGLQLALGDFGGSANDRAILLMTDGLQNTPPMIAAVEGGLGATRVNVVGFGSDADIDGPLLNQLARNHNGHFTRAIDGLSLRKFFGLAFGNIFESGALSDPDFVLGAAQTVSAPHLFDVCGEESITIVLGWDQVSTPLRAHIKTPSGKSLDERRVQPVRGQTWVFWRIPLPHRGERDGTWEFTVDRVPSGAEIPPPNNDVRYFILVVCSGGPKLVPLAARRRLYTGDPVDPIVSLHYRNRTTPADATVNLTIDTPTVALGQLVMSAGLLPPEPSADAVDAFHATLQAVARRSGGVLPVAPSSRSVPLFDDGFHNDGAMEPDGVYNNRLTDLTRVEGTYHFRAVATYGASCRASREAIWSLHVEPGIDAGKSGVTVVNITPVPGGSRGTVVIVPRDVYGNPIGPGRGGVFTVSPMPGVTITGPVKDNGDGSYGIGITWIDPTLPGVVIQQPDRDPVPLVPPGTSVPPKPHPKCNEAAENLLDCLGLSDPDVKQVRVKSICVEFDLKAKDSEKDCGC